MILTGPEIAREVRAGRIVIEPFDPSGCNPNSYDYRLGDEYIELSPSNGSNGAFRESPRQTIPPDGLLLQPQNLYLCHTLEKLGSDHYVTSLIGKSSMGRLGLFLQISADLGHQGEIHQWTLELRACLPIMVYPRMVIGQVTFWATTGSALYRPGYYARFDGPKPSAHADDSDQG